MNYIKPIVFGILVHMFCLGYPTGDSQYDNAASGYQSDVPENKRNQPQTPPPLRRGQRFVGNGLVPGTASPLDVADIVTIDEAALARVNEAAVAPTLERRVSVFYMLDGIQQVADSQDQSTRNPGNNV